MRIVLALDMYHYKVLVLKAKFDINQLNRMMITTMRFNWLISTHERIALFNFDILHFTK